MDAGQVRYTVNKYGVENFLSVQLNNSRTIFFSKPEEKLPENFNLNYGEEVIEYKQRNHGINMIYVVPFEIVEGIVINDGENLSFALEGNELKRDEDGKLDTIK